MTNTLTAIFLILHGLVHLLYFGQSARRFELQPGLTWPDGSWILSKLLGDNHTRRLASIFCIIAAIGFVLGGVSVLLGQSWWQILVVVSACISSFLYILFWNGKFKHLDSQGGVGLLLDIAILLAIYVFQWPQLEF